MHLEYTLAIRPLYVAHGFTVTCTDVLFYTYQLIERKVVFEAEEVKRVSMCVCVGVVFSLLISLLCSVIRLVLI